MRPATTSWHPDVEQDDPTGLGRIVREQRRHRAHRRAKDATEGARHQEINSGIMVAPTTPEEMAVAPCQQ
jgi:bifunctional N-acetylglucosamine-1-phosphate-uridyltransferase/glucosamine-1-phosphate-acetyltransferase GlmU-like protein